MKSKFLILFSIVLSGCLSGPDYYEKDVVPFLETVKKDYRPGVYDGVREPDVFPDLDEDQDTLLGIDRNKDGVRDDAEIYINRMSPYDYERETYKQGMRDFNNFFKNYKSWTKEQLHKFGNKLYYNNECLRYLTIYQKLPFAVEFKGRIVGILALNTRSRNAALSYLEQQLAGESSGSGVNSHLESFNTCPEKYKKRYPHFEQGHEG